MECEHAHDAGEPAGRHVGRCDFDLPFEKFRDASLATSEPTGLQSAKNALVPHGVENYRTDAT